MAMLNPPHPGEVIRELCLEPLGVSVTDAAKGLGVTRKTLSTLLNGRAGISAEMALEMKARGAGNVEIMRAIRDKLGHAPDSAGIGRCLARWTKEAGTV